MCVSLQHQQMKCINFKVALPCLHLQLLQGPQTLSKQHQKLTCSSIPLSKYRLHPMAPVSAKLGDKWSSRLTKRPCNYKQLLLLLTILILFARCVDSSPVLYAMLFGKSLASIDWLKLTLQTHKNVKVCNCTHSAAPLTPIAKELLMAVQKEREVIGVKLEKKWSLRVSHLMKESLFSKWSDASSNQVQTDLMLFGGRTCIFWVQSRPEKSLLMQQPHLTRDYHHHHW